MKNDQGLGSFSELVCLSAVREGQLVHQHSRNHELLQEKPECQQAGGRCTLTSHFCEGVTGRQTDSVQQSGKVRNNAAWAAVVRELRSYLIKHSGFSFKAHWKQMIFVLSPVGIRGLVPTQKLCL